MDKDKIRISTIALSISILLGTLPSIALADYSPAAQDDLTINNSENVTLDATTNATGDWDHLYRIIIGADVSAPSATNSGSLTISGGRAVSGFSGYIGAGSGSTGSLTISGAGSSLTLVDANDRNNNVLMPSIRLGTSGGQGELTVENGGYLYSEDTLEAGYLQNSTGIVNVSTGGHVEVLRSMTIGAQGIGRLNVTNAGKVTVGTAGQMLIAFENGSEGHVVVSGQNSELTVGRLIFVGSNLAGADSVGTLTINNGGVVNVNAAAGTASMGFGYNNISTGILNIGAAAGQSAVQAGTLNAENIIIGQKGVINFNHTDGDYEFASNTRGNGSLEHRGANSVTRLTGTHQYTGSTTVYDGTLQAGSNTAFSSASVFNVQTAGTLDLNGFDQTLSSLNLAGTLTFQREYAGAGSFTPVTLSVSDFVGNGGTIVFNTELNEDASLTDKLNVTGNASGTAFVAVKNAGGLGTQTLEGIELISIAGNSDATFTQQGRIVAGAYEYRLEKGSSTNDKNWYLTSTYSPAPEPTPDPDPTPTPTPTPSDDDQHVYRPEAGSYLANNAAANTLFITRLHDRLGETQYTDALTGEKKVTSLWMRHVGGHNGFKDGSEQLKTTSNRYVAQLGGDVAQWSRNGLDRWHLGVMGGYANNRSKTHSDVTDHTSRGHSTGYSAGLYGTWYANAEDKSGLYVDTWALYNWFDNRVEGEGLSAEKYSSKGVTASVESGYTFKLGQTQNASYWLQPKAQVIWMDVKADDHTESNGTRVQDDSAGNVMTRLGLRASMMGHSEQDNGKGREFQPFIEANWLHNTRNATVKMNETRDEQKGAKNVGEIKLGVEGMMSPRFTVWGNVGQQLGDAGYSDTSATLGMKYSF
ncbi:hypothetical protein SOASR030_11920 [Leminorella grimontii]|uniref:Autotransporter domain-containing protein n=1 Tax=Leminorella grimontii TaxID=82981 RepID=A0AAV5MYZ5_9GAMM|nr:autotransporter outer membrane beta-barrel domain-containing protein [Leminorella grimontii]KFC97560.1 autotransporter [Leminorella grimontii ATCC 33999 = DSM 5078]GKX55080.1 hypothetical protein SOASR030_11920 [Leminorella grimontii]VFS56956.1 Outer membrane protein IcsA autotransporter precursor [Leminorella grimontii]